MNDLIKGGGIYNSMEHIKYKYRKENLHMDKDLKIIWTNKILVYFGDKIGIFFLLLLFFKAFFFLFFLSFYF